MALSKKFPDWIPTSSQGLSLWSSPVALILVSHYRTRLLHWSPEAIFHCASLNWQPDVTSAPRRRNVLLLIRPGRHVSHSVLNLFSLLEEAPRQQVWLTLVLANIHGGYPLRLLPMPRLQLARAALTTPVTCEHFARLSNKTRRHRLA